MEISKGTTAKNSKSELTINNPKNKIIDRTAKTLEPILFLLFFIVIFVLSKIFCAYISMLIMLQKKQLILR